ncbi:hypothetical protein BDZ89DRAFT_989442 [Hymenopellis radicata]|nr:hypothetical protein BDZ89DRAFT_989442 [Hymenopellis radicata]
MTAHNTETNGFPEGYFIIRSVASNRLLDVSQDSIEDGATVILFPESETSLVESRRNPNSNNQVFFMDTSGALCSRSSGHALDIEDDRLVLRHRRPVSLPFPNPYSHPLPKFSYNKETAEIHVEFSCDPTYPPRASARISGSWKGQTYLLASIPVRRPRTILDDATEFISSTLAAPFSLFSGNTSPQSATPEDVFQNGVDLKEEEVLEEDRGEEAEVDDSPELSRSVRMLTIVNSAVDDHHLVEKASEQAEMADSYLSALSMPALLLKYSLSSTLVS